MTHKRIMRDSNGPGEIYLVQTPHCMHLHPTVFKTGRAHDSEERLRGYPKGTKLICCLAVSRMRDAEGAMLGSCRGDAGQVKERKDFGSEYFEADVGHLINKLIAVSHLFSWSFQQNLTDDEDEGEAEEEVKVTSPATLDATLLLGEYIRANIAYLSQTPVDSAELLNSVTKMLKDAGCTRRASPTLKALTHDLQKYFGADEIMSHRFPDGIPRHAIRFRKPVEPAKPASASASSRSSKFFQSFTMKVAL